MAGNIRRFFSNVICGTIPNRDTRRRVRVVLNSDMASHLRFIRRDLGVPLHNVRTFVGFLARSLLISVNNKYIYKFPLRRDNSDDLALREKRIVDALTPLSPIGIPSIDILAYNGRLVRKYDFVNGVQLRKCTPSWIRENQDVIASQLARFIYVVGCVNPPEIADLKTSPNAQPGYRYGWTQGDIYDNFLIDIKTKQIVAVIDWEDAYFGDFTTVFTKDQDPIAHEFMSRVLSEYDRLYYKTDCNQ